MSHDKPLAAKFMAGAIQLEAELKRTDATGLADTAGFGRSVLEARLAWAAMYIEKLENAIGYRDTQEAPTSLRASGEPAAPLDEVPYISGIAGNDGPFT